MKISQFPRVLLLSSIALFAVSGTVLARGASSSEGTSGMPTSDLRYSRADTTTFEELMRRTGVASEVPAMYTIFIPSNESLAAMTQAQYPCLYAPECNAQVAQILRHHIVSGNVNVSDVVRGKGGIFAIDKTQINVSEPSKGTYYIAGKKVLQTYGGVAGTTYVIDGVIATPTEEAYLQQPPTTLQTDHTITRDSYSSNNLNRPDGSTTTRTVTRTTTVTPETAIPAAGY